MVRRIILISISILFVYQIGNAQKEANVWYFGANAGLDFKSGNPVAIINGKMNASEGCSSYSTPSGRLLFYTDGVSVWDSTHNLMPNGNNLKGNSSSTQSVLIVPKPFTFNSFYIFTSDKIGGKEGITYSEVNMSYNYGKGDVVFWNKNKKLVTPACEKITAVKHANGIDFWLMVHKFDTDTLFAYRVTGYGVLAKPVRSKTGVKINGTYSTSLGYMKFSPDGRKLAYVNYTLDSSVIADFNSGTGRVSNVWTFHNDKAYGLEFSAQSKYLYISEFNTKKIYQYSAKSTTKSQFLNSKYTLDSNFSNDLGALQLGPNGKIYIAVSNSNYLQSIEAPDSLGALSRLKRNAVYLGGKNCILGLPNFNTSIFNKKIISVKHNCLNDTTTFTLSNTNDLDSVKWYFGDPSSGALNSSTQITNVGHIYKKPGAYKVWLFYYFKKVVSFAYVKVDIMNIKPYIGRDTSFCNAFNLQLSTAENYAEYLWSNKSTAKTIYAHKKGIYILKVKDTNSCSSSDTIQIHNPYVVANFSFSDTSLCLKNNQFNFKDVSFIDDDVRKKSDWTFGDGTHLSDTLAMKQYANAGTYDVKLKVTTQNNCSDSIQKSFTVKPGPVAAFDVNSPCFPDSVIFNNQSIFAQGKISFYWWDLGDGYYSSEKNPHHYYQEPAKYNVKLIVKAQNGCIDSITKHRTIIVKDKPKAVFTITDVSSLNGGNKKVQFNNYSTDNAVKFYWDLGKGRTSYEKNPSLNYLDSGKNKFTLWATTADNCSDSFSITTYHKFFFYLPNAFSPDENKINDTYTPFSSLFISYYKMQIYNQWGALLFESDDITQGWDGTYMSQLCPDGVYICKIALTPYNGVLEHHETSVRLMR